MAKYQKNKPPVFDNSEIQNILFAIKKECKIDQKEIAQRIPCKEPYLSEVANGKKPFTNSLRKKFLIAFGELIHISGNTSSLNTNQNDATVMGDSESTIASLRNIIFEKEKKIIDLKLENDKLKRKLGIPIETDGLGKQDEIQGPGDIEGRKKAG